jgi:hypothetical protein
MKILVVAAGDNKGADESLRYTLQTLSSFGIPYKIWARSVTQADTLSGMDRGGQGLLHSTDRQRYTGSFVLTANSGKNGLYYGIVLVGATTLTTAEVRQRTHFRCTPQYSQFQYR